MKQAVMPFEHAELAAKVDRAVKLLQTMAKSPVVCFSGGKDSVVIDALAKRAGLNYAKVYHVTTIDPPEVVQFCRSQQAHFDHPGTSYFREIENDGLPSRWRRWCCDRLKHGRPMPPGHDCIVLGVRKAESLARKLRWQEVKLDRKRGAIICPIVDWSDWDVWQFIEDEHLPVCSLYAEGRKRLGCIGCPLARGSRIRDFARWPKVAALIKRSYYRYADTCSSDYDADLFWHNWVNDLQGEGEEECQGNLELWA